MISTHDHLRLAGILRNHRYYAKRSTSRYLLWLSLREGLAEYLGKDTHFDRDSWMMLTELPSIDVAPALVDQIVRRSEGIFEDHSKG